MRRPFARMKKYLVLSAVLLGAVASSHAGGIDFHFRLPLPPLPHVVIGHPAPRVVVRAPVCLPPPPVVYVPRPHCPPPVVYHRPPVVYGRPYAYSSHHHGHHGRDGRGGYDRHTSYDHR